MNIIDIINKKEDAQELTNEEIKFVVGKTLKDSVKY